jgi:hypothetical protein
MIQYISINNSKENIMFTKIKEFLFGKPSVVEAPYKVETPAPTVEMVPAGTEATVAVPTAKPKAAPKAVAEPAPKAAAKPRAPKKATK